MHDLIEELRQQYTMANDGGGRNGYCRVNSGNLLDICRMAEFTEQQRDELMEKVNELETQIAGYKSEELERWGRNCE